MEQGISDIREVAIDRENFKACVRELSCEDVILERGLLEADLSDVAAVLGAVE